MSNYSSSPFLAEQSLETADEHGYSFLCSSSCLEDVECIEAPHDPQPEYKEGNEYMIDSALVICPKCGGIMTPQRLNESSYILMCESTESACIYPMDDAELTRYICETEDQIGDLINIINEYHLRLKEEEEMERNWYDVL